MDSSSHVKFLVYFHLKSDKTEERTLVFTNFLIQIQSTQGPPGKLIIKTEHTIPYIDITTIESKSKDNLTLYVNDKVYIFTTKCAENVDDVLLMTKHIALTLQASFPSVNVETAILKLEFADTSRVSVVRDALLSCRQHQHVGPCGGFKMSHDYFRIYFNAAKQEEVIWDIETVYVAQNTQTLTLRDFDHLDPKDWLPIVASVAYNSYFNVLDVSHLKLSVECQSHVINVVKRNRGLEGLFADGCGLKSDFCQRLGSVVSLENRLVCLDLSNNPGIEDRGLAHLCGMLGKMRRSLASVRLAGCSLSAKSANYLGDALCAPAGGHTSTSLTSLDIGSNALKGEELQSFLSFLAQPNSLTSLNLSRCESPIESLVTGLTRGCTLNLTHLDLSYNLFPPGSHLPATWAQFFGSALALRSVSLVHSRLTPAGLNALLDGLARNDVLSSTGGLELDISSNDLKVAGASVLAKHLDTNTAIISLNIADNDFNFELVKIITALKSNTKLQHLTIGSNFSGLKPRKEHCALVMESLSSLISHKNATLDSLSLVDAKLKDSLSILIDELANRTSLRSLDISGNAMGDVTARVLARVLCINSRLEELIWDRNGLSLRAIEEVVAALEHNYTLKRLALPVTDLAPFLSKFPERANLLFAKLDSAMKKNNGPRKFAVDKAFKLSQGFIQNTTQQYLDQLIVSLEQNCYRLSRSGDDSPGTLELVSEARGILDDSKASRHFLLRLQNTVDDNASKGDETVRKGIKTFSRELQDKVQAHIRDILEEMINVSKIECPHVCNEEATITKTREAALSHLRLPKDFVKKLLQKSLENDIRYKVEEVSLEVASAVSDSVLENIINRLDACLQRLTRAWTRVVRDHKRQTQALSVMSTVSDVEAAPEPSVEKVSSVSKSSLNILKVALKEENEEESDEPSDKEGSPVSMRDSIKPPPSKEQRESAVAQSRRRPRSSVVSSYLDEGEDSMGEYIHSSERHETLAETSDEEEENEVNDQKPSFSKNRTEVDNISRSISADSLSVNSLESALPSNSPSPLTSLTKSRPRRSKVHPPTVAPTSQSPSMSASASQDEGISASAQAPAMDIFALCASETSMNFRASSGSGGMERDRGSGRMSREQTPDSGLEDEPPSLLKELRQRERHRRSSTENGNGPADHTKTSSTKRKGSDPPPHPYTMPPSDPPSPSSPSLPQGVPKGGVNVMGGMSPLGFNAGSPSSPGPNMLAELRKRQKDIKNVSPTTNQEQPITGTLSSTLAASNKNTSPSPTLKKKESISESSSVKPPSNIRGLPIIASATQQYTRPTPTKLPSSSPDQTLTPKSSFKASTNSSPDPSASILTTLKPVSSRLSPSSDAPAKVTPPRSLGVMTIADEEAVAPVRRLSVRERANMIAAQAAANASSSSPGAIKPRPPPKPLNARDEQTDSSEEEILV